MSGILRNILTKIGTTAAAKGRTHLLLHCDTAHKRPIRLISLHNPRLSEGRAAPLMPCRQCHHRIHIGASNPPDANPVGMETRDHWRIHRIGSAEFTEQKWTASAEPLATI